MSAKALTLRQPYASLVAVGAKTIETRSFRTSYRGPLLIHAGKATPEVGSRVGHYGIGHHRLVYSDHIDEGYTLAETIGRQSPMGGAREYDTWPLPLGAVVASCRLVDCVPIADGAGDTPCIVQRHGVLWYDDGIGCYPHSAQLPFGDFSPGRYAWLLEDIESVQERCPRCWGDPQFPTDHRVEGGAENCRYCNRVFTFNFMRDPGPHYCDCQGARHAACPTCSARGSCAPVSMRGRQGLWTPKPEDWPA